MNENNSNLNQNNGLNTNTGLNINNQNGLVNNQVDQTISPQFNQNTTPVQDQNLNQLNSLNNLENTLEQVKLNNELQNQNINLQQLPNQPIQDINSLSSQPIEQPQPVINEIQGQSLDSIQPQTTPSNDNVNQNIQSFQSTNGETVFGPSQPVNPHNNVTNVGFVPSGAPLPKKKNKSIGILIALIILIGLGALGYFVVYPYVVKIFLNDPINVYNATIDTAFKQFNTTINDVIHEKAIYKLDVSLNSNLEALKDYAGYKIGLNFGIDPTNKSLQYGYSLKDSSNIEYSYNYYLKNNNQYTRYSTYRDLIYTGSTSNEELETLFGSFNDLFNNYESLNSEDLTYLSNKLSTLLKDSIDKNKLTKEDASITINGETLKVVNNKYEIDNANAKRTIDFIIDGLANDNKVLEILSKSQDQTKDEIKESLLELKENITTNEDKNEEILYVNIYTYDLKNKVVGYALTSNTSKADIHYYNKDNYFELIFNNNEDKDSTINLSIIGKKENDTTKVTIKFNDEELLLLDINTWNDNKIDLSYNLKNESGDIKGSLKYERNQTKEALNIKIEFSLEVEDEYIKLNFDFTEDWNNEVAYINTSNAVTLTNEEIENIKKEFQTALNSTALGDFFKTISGDYDPDINDYYDYNDDDKNNEEENNDNSETGTNDNTSDNNAV